MTGLSLTSEFVLPGLPLLSEGADASPDVRIVAGADMLTAEAGWAAQSARGRATPGELWFRPEPGLFFKVADTGDVQVYRTPRHDDGHIGSYLAGLIWGALCHRRGLLPLHCSAILHDGRAFAFSGQSGAGKSTLAAGLGKRGYPICCDDLLAIDPAAAVPHIYTAPHGLRLCEDAVARFGIIDHAPSRLKNGMMKYHVPLSPAPMPQTAALAALFILGDDDGPPQIKPVLGEARWRALFASVYVVRMLPWVSSRSTVAATLAGIADRVPVYRFVRPRDVARFDEGLDAIEQFIRAPAEIDTRLTHRYAS